MHAAFRTHILNQLNEIETGGLFKRERILSSPQGAWVETGGRRVLNLCANNYLGLSSHPEVIRAAHEGLDRWGYGLSSVRFICGTQEIHRQLEDRLTRFLGTEDTILYGSCFDANGGLFETLLGEEDAVISDELNHASIIDGIRLCKARRLRFRSGDMDELTRRLEEAQDARFRLIATDGVFSMDGAIARLKEICDLADRYGALVMVDDSHGAGVLGAHGRGSHEYCGVMGRIDLITGTLGKALGGATGGYTSGRKELIQYLRQRSRPYLFSNTLAPMVCAASLKAIDLVESSPHLRERLMEHARYFRQEMEQLGFDITPGEHPIVPVMIGEAADAQKMADILLQKGVYVVGFSYPVVPKGSARIRVQLSAAHTREDLDFALRMFSEAREEMRGTLRQRSSRPPCRRQKTPRPPLQGGDA